MVPLCGILFISCRREALSVWKDKQGLEATYGILLELFETAGHSQCAKAVCEVLKKKHSVHSTK